MSYALADLKRLLTPDISVSGSVVATPSPGMVRVATPGGAVLARALTTLPVGTRVLVRTGIATAAPVARQSYPV